MLRMRKQHLCMGILAALILLFMAGCGDDQTTQHSDGDVDRDITDTAEDSEDGDITEQETDGDVVDEDKPAEGEGSEEEEITDGDADGDAEEEGEVEDETAGPPPLPGFEGFSAAGGTMQGQGMLLHFSFAPARIGSATRATNGSMTLKSVVTPTSLPTQP